MRGFQTFLCFLICLLLNKGQNVDDTEFKSDVFITSTTHSGVEIYLNATTGSHEERPKGRTTVFVASGPVAAESQFVLQLAQDNPNTFGITEDHYSLDLGTVEYEFDIEAVGYVPKKLGQVHIKVDSAFLENEGTRRKEAREILKAALLESATGADVDDDANFDGITNDFESKRKRKRAPEITLAEEDEETENKDGISSRGTPRLVTEIKASRGKFSLEEFLIGKSKALLGYFVSFPERSYEVERGPLDQLLNDLKDETNEPWIRIEIPGSQMFDIRTRQLREYLKHNEERKEGVAWERFLKTFGTDLSNDLQYMETHHPGCLFLVHTHHLTWVYAEDAELKERMETEHSFLVCPQNRDLKSKPLLLNSPTPKKRGRQKRCAGLCIGGMVGVASISQEVFDQIGDPVCSKLKSGAAILGDLNMYCLWKAQEISARLAARVDNLEAQMDLALEAAEKLTEVAEQFAEIQENVQTQINLVQNQIDVINDEVVNVNQRVDDVVRMVNTHGRAINELTLADDMLTVSINRVERTMNNNFEIMSNRLVGLSELVDEQISTLNSQLSYVEIRAKSNIQTATRQIYVDMAVQVVRLTQMIAKLGVDLDARMATVVQDISFYLNELKVQGAIHSNQITRLNNFVKTLYNSVRDLMRHQFGSVDIALQYWLYKMTIESQAPEVIPYVVEGTGRRPPRNKEESTRDGIRVRYSYVSIPRCNITIAGLELIKQQVREVLSANATARYWVPLHRHAGYLRFTVRDVDAGLLTSFGTSLREYYLTAWVRIQGVLRRFVPYNLGGTNVLAWKEFNPNANANNPSLSVFSQNGGLSCIFISVDSPSRSGEPLVVRDGDKVKIACYFGLTAFSVTIDNPSGSIYRLALLNNVIGASQPASQVLQIRNTVQDLVESNQRLIRLEPFSVDDSFYISRFPESTYSQISTLPTLYQRLSIPSSQFSPSIPGLSGDSFVEAFTFFPAFVNKVDLTQTQNTEVSESALNSTLNIFRDDFVTVYGPVPLVPSALLTGSKKRKRSSVFEAENDAQPRPQKVWPFTPEELHNPFESTGSNKRKRDFGSKAHLNRRRKRNLLAPLPTFEECYGGLHRYNSPETRVRDYKMILREDSAPRLNGRKGRGWPTFTFAKDEIRTCSSRPGCSYYFVEHPTYLLGFSEKNFTGTMTMINAPRPEGDTKSIPLQFFGSQNIKSAIFFPGIVSSRFLDPLLPDNQRCEIWDFACLLVVGTPCAKLLQLTNWDPAKTASWKANMASYCLDYLGTNGGIVGGAATTSESWGNPYNVWDSLSQPIKNEILARQVTTYYDFDFGAFPKNKFLCPKGNTETVYSRACPVRDKSGVRCAGNAVTISPSDPRNYQITTTNPYGEFEQGLMNQKCRDGVKSRLRRELSSPLFTKGNGPDVTYYDGSEETTHAYGFEPSCLKCAAGFGSTIDGNSCADKGVCSPVPLFRDAAPQFGAGITTLLWNEGDTFTFTDALLATTTTSRFQPSRPALDSSFTTDDRFLLGFCGAAVPGRLNVAANLNRQATLDVKFPYFHTPGDAGPGFQANSIPIIQDYVDCRRLNTIQCEQDPNTDRCILIVDAARAQNIFFDLPKKCVDVVDNPCAQHGTVTQCINYREQGVYMCMWNTLRTDTRNYITRCFPVQPGTTDAINLSSGFNGYLPQPNVILPCVYREVTTGTDKGEFQGIYCSYDNYCLFILAKGNNEASRRLGFETVTPIKKCVPIRDGASLSAHATYAPGAISLFNTTFLTSQAAAQNLLNVTLGLSVTDQQDCLRYGVECSLAMHRVLVHSEINTARLYAVLNLALGTPKVTSLAFRLQADTLCSLEHDATHCELKYVNSEPGWRRGYLRESLRYDSLVQGCVTYGGTCRANCEIFDNDLERCLQLDYCMVDRATLKCLQSTPTNALKTCPGQDSANFQFNSPCINRGNVCNLLSATLALNNTVLTYNETFSEATNDGRAQASECAQLAGVISGSLSRLSSSARLSAFGTSLPQMLNRRCTAYVGPDEIVCKDATMTGECDRSDFCNTINDPLKRMRELITFEYCAYNDLPSCVLASRDGFKTFQCGWIETVGKLGRCALLQEALNAQRYGRSIKIHTESSYRRENLKRAVIVEGTRNQLLNIGMDILQPGVVTLTPLTADPYQDIIPLGAITIPCEKSTQRTQGYGCCTGNACRDWAPNPYHPKQVFLQGIRDQCQEASTDVVRETFISIACSQKNHATLFEIPLPSGENVFYSCMGYAAPEQINSLLLFADEDDLDTQPLPVWVDNEQFVMIPLQKHVINTTYPEARRLAAAEEFCYLNTCFYFDMVTSLTATSLGNPNSKIYMSNTTSFVFPHSSGNYSDITLTGSSILSKVESDIDVYVETMRGVYGDNPVGWELNIDYGVKRQSYGAGTSSTGVDTVRTEELVMAFGSPASDIPVWKVISSRFRSTASMRRRRDGALIPLGDIKTNNPQENQLLRPGEHFIFSNDTNYLYGVPDGHIGLGIPFKVGYIFTDTKQTSFNISKWILDHPLFDARFSTLSPDIFKSKRISGAEPYSSEAFCGENVVSLVDRSSVELRVLFLNVTILGGFGLSPEQVAFWRTEILLALDDPSTFLPFLESFLRDVKQMWVDVGCLREFVNYQEMGVSFDYLYQWYRLMRIGSEPFTLPYQFAWGQIEQAMRAIFNSAKHAHCGNCIVTQEAQNDETLSSGVSFCDKRFGNIYPTPPPSFQAFDIQKSTNLRFCVPSSFYEIEFSETNRKVIMRLKPGSGTLKTTWRLPDHEILSQFSTETICITNPINATVSPVSVGAYLITLRNVYTIPVSFDFRIRTNVTQLSEKFPIPAPCDSDVAGSVGPLQENTFSLPICSSEEIFIQIYNLAGFPCSQILSTRIDYTVVPLNMTQNTYISATIVDASLLKSSRALVESFKKEFESEFLTQVERIDLKLQESLFNVNYNLSQIFEGYGIISDLLRSQESVVTNLAGKGIFTETQLFKLNTSLTSLASQMELVRYLVERVETDGNTLRGDIIDSIENLNDLTNLSDQVYNISYYNGLILNDIVQKLVEINQLIDTAQNLKPFYENSRDIVGEARKTRNSLMILAYIGGGVGTLIVLIIGIIICMKCA